MITAKIFRAYDIRGVYNADFDLQGAEDIGRGYGTYLLKTSVNHERPLRVCVGRDGRTHGPDVHEAFMRGLESTGIQVVNVGPCFSPLLFYAICEGRFDGGVNITASHNPKEYNGFKLQREDAQAICGDEIQEILNIIETRNFINSEERYEIEEEHFWKSYADFVVNQSHQQSKTKIVIDAGNGITGMYAPDLFRRLGYEVIELYCDVDGEFPNHPADPEEKENMKDLQHVVVHEKAQFGIAFDGDGDRVGIVDDEGTIYDADHLLMLLSKDVLSRHPGTSVVYTVTTSGLVKEEIQNNKGIAVESKVGHSFVEEKMRDTGALLGGESSGHIFFAENYFGFDDGVLAAVRILEIVLKSGIPLKEHFFHLPKVFTSDEIKVAVPDEKKFELVEKVKERFLKDYPCNTIDGVKVDFGNHAWAVCRASNTSPKVSFRCEARDEQTMSEVLAKMELVLDEEKEKLI